jgi:hypothetical protein
MRETLKQAGYKKIEALGDGEFILTNKEGKRELWFANIHHGSYGIRYKNTMLEFCRTIGEENQI